METPVNCAEVAEIRRRLDGADEVTRATALLDFIKAQKHLLKTDALSVDQREGACFGYVFEDERDKRHASDILLGWLALPNARTTLFHAQLRGVCDRATMFYADEEG